MWRWWCVSVRRYDYSFETSCEDVLSMKCILLRCDAFYIYIYIYIYIYKKCSDFTEKSAVWIPCFLDPCYTECRKNQFIFYLPLIFFHLILVFFYPVFQNSRPIFCRPNGNILNQFHPRPPPPTPTSPYDLVITFERCQKLHRISRLWSAWIACKGWIFYDFLCLHRF